MLKIFIFSGVFLVLISYKCNNSEKGDKKEIEFQIPQDWHCFEVQYERICFPEKWKPENQSDVLFFTKINDLNNHTYFTVLRYDVEINEINLEDYIREGYKVLISDTVEVFIEYMLTELVFEDRKAFYGELTTEINDSLYISFVMYTVVEGMIYDWTLKVLKSERPNYYRLFQDILYCYKSNGKVIFTRESNLKSTRDIDLKNF